MNTYADAVSYLYGLQKFGIKMGLDNIRALLAASGDPHLAYPTVHVAGTNGKGSTSAFIASILSSACIRTGLYTSPHLVDFRERIRVEGVPISEADVLSLARELQPVIDERNATFFEATTAMAFRYFAQKRVGAAVIETGLGGRLDSTNVIQPVLCVITGVAMDHMEYLGSTLAEIAAEKAGIIKAAVPVVSATLQPEAMEVITNTARELGAPLHVVPTMAGIEQLVDIDHMEFDAAVLRSFERFVSPLVGDHQASNARLAIRAAELLATSIGRVATWSIIDGIKEVKPHSGIAGRLERIAVDPELVVDVAHNPDGVAAMLQTWTTLRATAKTHLVFGMLRSKNTAEVLRLLSGHDWSSVTAVDMPHADGRSAADIAGECEAVNLKIECARDVYQAVRLKTEQAQAGESVLLFGSHYLVGAYLAARKKSEGGTDRH